MSKIMNQIFAEARAAREKAVNDGERRSEKAEVSAPEQRSPSSIEWWETQYALAGRAAMSKVAFEAIKAIEHPCSPPDHIAWWACTSKCQR
jgi:hypothetical protein